MTNTGGENPRTPTETLRLVFMFVEFGKNNKPVTLWLREEDMDAQSSADDPRVLVYDAKLKGALGMARVTPGMIIEVQTTHTKDCLSIFPKTARYVGQCTTHRETIESWEANDIATRGMLQAASAAKRAVLDTHFIGHVTALRKAMRKLRAPQRAQMIAWIVAELAEYS